MNNYTHAAIMYNSLVILTLLRTYVYNVLQMTKVQFRRFLMNRECFPNEWKHLEQWLFKALSVQMVQKPHKFSLHFDEIQ